MLSRLINRRCITIIIYHSHSPLWIGVCQIVDPLTAQVHARYHCDYETDHSLTLIVLRFREDGRRAAAVQSLIRSRRLINPCKRILRVACADLLLLGRRREMKTLTRLPELYRRKTADVMCDLTNYFCLKLECGNSKRRNNN